MAIHISKIHILAELHKEFSLCWVAQDGRRIFCPRCRMTSFHSSGKTFNVLLIDSGEIRKVNRYTITEFNGEEVVM